MTTNLSLSQEDAIIDAYTTIFNINNGLLVVDGSEECEKSLCELQGILYHNFEDILKNVAIELGAVE